MELGEHRHDGGAFRRLVVAEPTRLAGYEREQGDRVAWPEPTHRLAAARGHRRDHELEAAVAECDRGVERASETSERRLARVSEPVLPVEVVDGHEGTRSLAVAHHPVVAAPADGRVLGRVDVEAPVVGESADQVARLDVLRQRPHATKSKPRARWVGRTRREIPSEAVTTILTLTAAAALALGAARLHAAGDSVPLRLVANVTLPGPSNRFDYTSLDPTTNRLYIAHMNAGQLLVFDTRRRRVLRTIAAPGVHGVIAVPQLHRVYASATDARQLFTIDSRTGRVLRRAPAGSYPDGLVYDPAERRVFVSDESGGVEAVFDAAGHRIATVQLGGEAGNVQYDPGSHRILADVQTRNQVAVIDPSSNVVVRRVALPGCDHPHGLYVDAPRRLAFVACDGNARLLTLDLTRMKVTGSMQVGSSPDVLAFDTSLEAALRLGGVRRRRSLRRARAKPEEARAGAARA